MSKATDGIELTRVGEGTVMGDLMRCYWIPALMSSELVRDGAPVRLMLLGEKLIAFRDSAGRVGVMDHRCPHRCASLFLGRNEEEGIRCIYHGWKFDVAGNCVDMPSLPPPGFKEKVKAKAYKVVERAGVVWVYMGTRAEAPPLPAFEILDLPEDEVKVTFIQRDCNYLQALEGEIDTSHFGFLHAGHVDPDDLSEDEPVRNTVINRAPEYHLADTEWGTQYAGYRDVRRGGPTGASAISCFRSGRRRRTASSARTCMRAAGCRSTMTHTMFVFLSWKKAVHAGSLPQPAFKDGSPIGGTGRANKLLPNTTDWLGRWRMAANAGNDWEIDRDGAAEQPDLQRDRRHPPAGPGDHREHGPDRRPRVRASRAVGPDDHAHAPAPADGSARVARKRHRAAGGRQPGGLSRRTLRLSGEPGPEPLARALCQAVRGIRASPAEPAARGGVDILPRPDAIVARPGPMLA